MRFGCRRLAYNPVGPQACAGSL